MLTYMPYACWEIQMFAECWTVISCYPCGYSNTAIEVLDIVALPDMVN